MNVTSDLVNLSIYWKMRLLRLTRKLLKKYPNIHSIIISRQGAGLKSAEKFTEFELFLFLNEEADSEKGISHSLKSGHPQGSADSYRIYEPGMGYKRSERSHAESETEALHYGFGTLSPELKQDYLNFLNTHCCFFETDGFPGITTLNSTEMKKDDSRFYGFYITGQFDNGYLICHREVKPKISLP